MEAISLGIDLIGTDLPTVMTRVGYAFSRLNGDDTDQGQNYEPPSKKMKSISSVDIANSRLSEEENSQMIINIRDKKYFRDERPLVLYIDLYSVFISIFYSFIS